MFQATLVKDVGCDLAVDIWSLGCSIIEMLNGKPPWSHLEGPAAAFKVLHKDPPLPENLSQEGKDFLQCCLKRNPAERPSARELLNHPFVQNSSHEEVITAGCEGVIRTSCDAPLQGETTTRGAPLFFISSGANDDSGRPSESSASRLTPQPVQDTSQKTKLNVDWHPDRPSIFKAITTDLLGGTPRKLPDTYRRPNSWSGSRGKDC